MKNRETINRRLERIDSNLSIMSSYASRGERTRDEWIEIINSTRELVAEAKAFIEQEPMSPNEINK